MTRSQAGSCSGVTATRCHLSTWGSSGSSSYSSRIRPGQCSEVKQGMVTPPSPGLGMVACGMVTICGVEQVEAAPPQ